MIGGPRRIAVGLASLAALAVASPPAATASGTAHAAADPGTCPTGLTQPYWRPGDGFRLWRSDGRGPNRGPFEWFTAPTVQPQVAGNPISGVPWFVDCNWDEAWMGARRAEDWSASQKRYVTSAQKPATTALLGTMIARQPIAKWFGPTKSGMYQTVRDYLERTSEQAPGAVRFIVFRRLESGNCRAYRLPDQKVYGPRVHAQLVADFARAVRDSDADGFGGPLVVVIEPDVMPSIKCTLASIRSASFRRQVLNTRLAEIRNAIGAFADLPDTTTYVDAGASDYVGWKAQVGYLKAVGINRIRGFSLNVTHYDWTRDNVLYGTKLAQALGVHFVVSTGRAGGGNLPDRLIPKGYERGCNIPNAGLGPVPTVLTANRYVDAYLWLLNPGFSDGNCLSGRKSYRTANVHWTQTLALRLIKQRCQTGARCYGRGRPSYYE